MHILLTGVSGFVGSTLAGRLLEEGHELRAFARDRTRVEQALGLASTVQASELDLVIGDTLTGAGLPQAMRGIDVAYYLIHSMEPGVGAQFPMHERASAEAFAHAARAAGVERIVYLGGLLPDSSVTSPSTHLASRHAVERILLEAIPDSIALRASIVIGARSRSFRFLVRLVERLPVLTLPAWKDFRTQPIDERDVIEMLSACADAQSVSGRSLDIGGPDVLSYREMIERIAELMMLARPSIGLRVNLTGVAARVAAVLTDETPELVVALMEGLGSDLLVSDNRAPGAPDLLNVRLHSFDSAVEHALHEWEKIEPLAAR